MTFPKPCIVCKGSGLSEDKELIYNNDKSVTWQHTKCNLCYGEGYEEGDCFNKPPKAVILDNYVFYHYNIVSGEVKYVYNTNAYPYKALFGLGREVTVQF